ncbi:hypothetical protein NDU88_004384 [Pleurodeles waltl]|uniref:Uncharacterized protein n=1 Tax=Pleurodeles waltl TaxID=8319 RepID=A0AAV7LI50_PLEWA|nr:hypothetical protein NDU88_004384 [Pleurodeles waltl]
MHFRKPRSPGWQTVTPGPQGDTAAHLTARNAIPEPAATRAQQAKWHDKPLVPQASSEASSASRPLVPAPTLEVPPPPIGRPSSHGASDPSAPAWVQPLVYLGQRPHLSSPPPQPFRALPVQVRDHLAQTALSQTSRIARVPPPPPRHQTLETGFRDAGTHQPSSRSTRSALPARRSRRITEGFHRGREHTRSTSRRLCSLATPPR